MGSQLSTLNAQPRILLRGVNWLGDAVMTLPAVRRVREAFPRAHVSLLTPEKLGELWQGHPALDAVLTFAPGESVFQVARRLRQGRFDLALVLPNSPRSALEAFLGRIPRRVGLARPGRNLLLTVRVPPRPGAARMRKRPVPEIRRLVQDNSSAECGVRNAELQRPAATGHQIYDYLHLAAAVGADPAPLAPCLAVGPAEVARAGAQFLPASALDIPWFGLNPGAEYGPAKRWPADRYAQAAAALARQTGCGWLLLGGRADQRLTAQIAAALRQEGRIIALDLAGQTTLRELCALLKACRVLLTNDSGPMHLAAAVGTPVVVPFGSTSPELTGPGLPQALDSPHALLRAGVPCAPCFRRECPIDLRCLRGISVDQVVPAALEVLAR